MNLQRNKTRIIIASVIGIIAFITVNLYMHHLQKQIDNQKKLIMLMQKTSATMTQYEYVVAAKEIKSGSLVKEEDLKLIKSTTKNDGAITNTKDILGEAVLEDIKSEDVLLTKHFAKDFSKTEDPGTLNDGQRALTLDISNFQGLSQDMTPAKSVDMYSTSKDNRWYLGGVKILSCDAPADKSGGCTSLTKAKTVTFAVPDEKITEIIDSISQSKILLVLSSEKSKGAKNSNYAKLANNQPTRSYSPSSAPNIGKMEALPNLPYLNSPETEGLPAPFMPSGAPVSRGSIEIIQANTKSNIDY